MQLQRLIAQRFRNLVDLETAFGPGMNVIHGQNAQGKTNLLEAVYVLSTLRSFRTRHLPECVRFGESDSLVQGVVHSAQGRHQLAVWLDQRRRIGSLDRKEADALHYLGTLNVFLFSYPMLEVVRGGPEERRRFFDRSIAVSRPGYLGRLMQYHRALKQKNALLLLLQRGERSRRDGLNELASFNQQLLEHGLEIACQRAEYLQQLQELLKDKQALFFENDVVLGIEPVSSFLASRAEAESNLARIADREIARGTSLVGVHRDEIKMMICGKELRKFGSSGQHRAFLLLLLLAQLELYERLRGDRPLLLMDDLDSELDQGKIQAFLREIQNRYQTLISSSRAELFSKDADIRLFEIRTGKLLER